MKKSHEDLLSRLDSLELCFLLTIFAQSENELEFNFVLTLQHFTNTFLFSNRSPFEIALALGNIIIHLPLKNVMEPKLKAGLP